MIPQTAGIKEICPVLKNSQSFGFKVKALKIPNSCGNTRNGMFFNHNFLYDGFGVQIEYFLYRGRYDTHLGTSMSILALMVLELLEVKVSDVTHVTREMALQLINWTRPQNNWTTSQSV